MSYSFPSLDCTNPAVATAIIAATDRSLQQAHYLLTARFSGDTPHNHFGYSAAVMSILSIAAASSLRCFDSKKNRPPKGSDERNFTYCVKNYFPWGHFSIRDGQHRPERKHKTILADQLYNSFRRPIVHSGGMVGISWPKVTIDHVLPGLATREENEEIIAEYSKCNTLNGETLLRIEADRSIVYPKVLYWCTRKMIENLSADPTLEQDLLNNGVINPAVIKIASPQRSTALA